MFDHLLEENDLSSEPLFEVEGNRTFIKEMITGKPVTVQPLLSSPPQAPHEHVCSTQRHLVYNESSVCMIVHLNMIIVHNHHNIRIGNTVEEERR